MTYGQVRWPILWIRALHLTIQSAHTHTHSSEHTHTQQWTHTHTQQWTHILWTHTRSSGQPFMLRRPGNSWGFGASRVSPQPWDWRWRECSTSNCLPLESNCLPLGHDFPTTFLVCHASWSYTTSIYTRSLETVWSDSSFPLGRWEGESPEVNTNRYSLVFNYLKPVELYSRTHSLLQWIVCAKCTFGSLEVNFDLHLCLTFQEEVSLCDYMFWRNSWAWLRVDFEQVLSFWQRIKDLVTSLCSCGSVVEHCVSSAKGCGFNSQGTHILTK